MVSCWTARLTDLKQRKQNVSVAATHSANFKYCSMPFWFWLLLLRLALSCTESHYEVDSSGNAEAIRRRH